MKKSTCFKCGYQFSNKGGNYNKHVKSCNGSYKPFVKRLTCKHCSLDFSELNASVRANHSRWCDKNPKRSSYYGGSGSTGAQLNTSEAIAKRRLSIKKAHADGKYDNVVRVGFTGRKHTDETKGLMSQKGLESKHRRLRRKMIEYNGVMLDSTWELVLAIRLDELKIKWIRPDPIEWIDDRGITHNYFPDFYLIYHDLYLDPKNPRAYEVQKNKIARLKDQIPNLIILTTLNECKNFKPYID